MIKDKSKYIAWLASATLLGITPIFAPPTTLAQQTSFLPYYNSNLGVSLQYPSDWTAIEGGTGVMFFSPPETASSVPGARLLISVMPNLYTPISQVADQVPYVLQTSLTDFALLQSEPITINGNTAHQYVYTYYDPNFGPTEALDIILTNGYNTYGITYSADPANYGFYLPSIGSMINSFQTSTGSVSAGNMYSGTVPDGSSPSVGPDTSGTDAGGLIGQLGDKLPYDIASDIVGSESATDDTIIGNMN